ncbi:MULTISPECIES: site-specific integrase [unclassified Nocardia]|uniref:site-specific integrase n=1 Tax=unclassified Nocardia TaxID=2637762 RepID=UPI003419ABFD
MRTRIGRFSSGIADFPAAEFTRRLGKVRPHDLRHTYAGRLVRAWVPIQQVQKLLGHASLRTTQRYASLADSQWGSVGVLG